MELSILCDCEVALIIFNTNNKLYQYASDDIKSTLTKFEEFGEVHSEFNNKDVSTLALYFKQDINEASFYFHRHQSN